MICYPHLPPVYWLTFPGNWQLTIILRVPQRSTNRCSEETFYVNTSVLALLRIKPHAPPVAAPVNSLSRGRTPQGSLNAFAALSPGKGLTPSTHRLRRGLPGYLILFAPQLSSLSVSYRLQPLSPPVFLHISTHFTADTLPFCTQV